MKTYFVSLERGSQGIDLAAALLEEGARPEGISLILDETYADRVTDTSPVSPPERIEQDLIVDTANRDLRFATTGNPEMERAFKPPHDDPSPLFESEIGAGISTASPNDNVSSIEEMDDAVEAAEESLYPDGAHDIRTNGPNSFSEIDSEAVAPTRAGAEVRSSATGIHGLDSGFGVGVFAALIPAAVPGLGIVLGDGPLADDLLAESEQGEVDLHRFLVGKGLDDSEALRAETCLAQGGCLLEVAAASGEASARQIHALLAQYEVRRIRELTAI